ncbi:MAG: hypothetical protein NTZ68_04345 [Candidatus Dependentiae bacterium]|nr:hypothetical protein [Candidatus Dependentiae bacterium]
MEKRSKLLITLAAFMGLQAAAVRADVWSVIDVVKFVKEKTPAVPIAAPIMPTGAVIVTSQALVNSPQSIVPSAALVAPYYMYYVVSGKEPQTISWSTGQRVLFVLNDAVSTQLQSQFPSDIIITEGATYQADEGSPALEFTALGFADSALVSRLGGSTSALNSTNVYWWGGMTDLNTAIGKLNTTNYLALTYNPAKQTIDVYQAPVLSAAAAQTPAQIAAAAAAKAKAAKAKGLDIAKTVTTNAKFNNFSDFGKNHPSFMSFTFKDTTGKAIATFSVFDDNSTVGTQGSSVIPLDVSDVNFESFDWSKGVTFLPVAADDLSGILKDLTSDDAPSKLGLVITGTDNVTKAVSSYTVKLPIPTTLPTGTVWSNSIDFTINQQKPVVTFLFPNQITVTGPNPTVAAAQAKAAKAKAKEYSSLQSFSLSQLQEQITLNPSTPATGSIALVANSTVPASMNINFGTASAFSFFGDASKAGTKSNGTVAAAMPTISAAQWAQGVTFVMLAFDGTTPAANFIPKITKATQPATFYMFVYDSTGRLIKGYPVQVPLDGASTVSQNYGTWDSKTPISANTLQVGGTGEVLNATYPAAFTITGATPAASAALAAAQETALNTYARVDKALTTLTLSPVYDNGVVSDLALIAGGTAQGGTRNALAAAIASAVAKGDSVTLGIVVSFDTTTVPNTSIPVIDVAAFANGTFIGSWTYRDTKNNASSLAVGFNMTLKTSKSAEAKIVLIALPNTDTSLNVFNILLGATVSSGDFTVQQQFEGGLPFVGFTGAILQLPYTLRYSLANGTAGSVTWSKANEYVIFAESGSQLANGGYGNVVVIPAPASSVQIATLTVGDSTGQYDVQQFGNIQSGMTEINGTTYGGLLLSFGYKINTMALTYSQRK